MAVNGPHGRFGLAQWSEPVLSLILHLCVHPRRDLRDTASPTVLSEVGTKAWPVSQRVGLPQLPLRGSRTWLVGLSKCFRNAG